MVYVFDSNFDRYKANRIFKIIKAGALAEVTATRMIAQLRNKALSYDNSKMLHDIRRARAIEFSKTANSYYNAQLFFDYVYEPFRSDYGLKSSEASKIFRDRDREFWETDEELNQIMNIDDRYIAIQELF